MEYTILLLLFAAGIVAGILNVIAGGGSLLTLPIMIFAGMPPVVANGTNRIAIFVQNISAVASFKSKGYSEFSDSLKLALCALPGTLLGAWMGVRLSGETFQAILGVVLIIAAVFINLPIKNRQLVSMRFGYVLMILLGFYVGFIQAGVGFLFILILNGLLGLDMIRTNMHKVTIVGLCTAPALVIYLWKADVWIVHGLCLAAGNALGAWAGTHITIKSGQKTIKLIVSVVIVLFSIKLWL